MDLWWRLRGWYRVRLTGADPMADLRLLSKRFRLEDIQWESGLSLRFLVFSGDYEPLCALAEKRGSRVELLERHGLPRQMAKLRAMPLVLGVLAVLMLLSLWLPSRVLFLRVEGSGPLPERLILEAAEECGLKFGCSRRDIRSEQLKNQLLHRLPQLSWAGVNTSGCSAVLTVRPRQLEPPTPGDEPGSIFAARSGIITDFTCTAGTPLCRVGQAVQKGQMLFSGVTDLGCCTKIGRAEGEVFAQTVREIQTVCPQKMEISVEKSGHRRFYSLRLGKKRINLHSNSGILYPGCGKMEKVIPLRLPGGFELPAAWIVSTYEQTVWRPAQRSERTAQTLLLEAAQRHTLQDTVAGTLRQRTLRLVQDGPLFRLNGQIGCREMIGRFAQGIIWKDDAKDDRTSGECGAG